MTVLDYSVAQLALWRKKVRWMPLLLSVLAWPFVALGATAAATVVAYRFVLASVQTGYADVRGRYPRAG